MSIRKKSFISQVRPRQNKSVKHTPISEGGLGLTPRTDGGSVDDDIKKAKENKLAQYWYDKYENLVKEVSYERKIDRKNLDELDEKLDGVNQDLLSEISTISDNDPLVEGEQKFVTFEKLSEHNKVYFSRIQKQLSTIGGGGIGQISDDPSPKFGGNLDLNSKDITGTGNITHTGNLTTTGNGSFSGTLDVSGVTTFSNVVISDGGTIGSSSDTDAITISSAGLVTLSAAASLSVTGTTTFNQDVNFPGALYNIHWDQPTSKFKFDDNAQCVFGSASGGDMRLFHAGGNSTIKNETGQFRLAGNDIRLQTQNNSEDYIICTDGGAVQIFHNDVEKFTTTSTGISVTGNIVISDDGNIGSSSDTDAIAIAADGTVTFSSDVVVSDDLLVTQRIRHVGDTDTYIEFTDDQIRLIAGGKSLIEATETTTDTVVINEDSHDLDFRIEGNGDANLFFTDGGNDRVGIGTNSPSKLLHVDGDAKIGSSQSAGVILTSPNGTEYRLIVADDGTLSTTAA